MSKQKGLLNESNLLETLNECDKIANSNLAKMLSGREIFYLNDSFTESEFVANTTVSDIESVIGKVDIFCAINGHWKNRVVRFRNARKKEFMNTLRFTPPKTYVVEQYLECVESGFVSNPTPMTQNEGVVKSINPKDGFVTDDVLNKTWNCLYSDKKYIKDKANRPLSIEVSNELAQTCQEIVDRLYTIKNSFIINYISNNIRFLIPVNYEDLNEALKNRDKTNGRKPMLPIVIDEYIKNDGTIVNKYFRASKDNSFTINDKNISLTYGSDILPIMFPKSKYGLNKAKNFMRTEYGYEII